MELGARVRDKKYNRSFVGTIVELLGDGYYYVKWDFTGDHQISELRREDEIEPIG